MLTYPAWIDYAWYHSFHAADHHVVEVETGGCFKINPLITGKVVSWRPQQARKASTVHLCIRSISQQYGVAGSNERVRWPGM